MSSSRAEACGRRHNLPQIFARAAYRRSLSLRIRLERRPSPSAHGPCGALCGPGRTRATSAAVARREFPSMKMYPTIAEALTLRRQQTGRGRRSASSASTGKYPRNEKGQTKYPRWEFFQQIVKVYRDSGRSVPLFNDKHLSWNWDWAKQMYDTSRDMGFAFMAGSSLPGHLAHSVGRNAARLAHPRSPVRLLRRRRQLRFSRPRNHPVHGGAPPGRRDAASNGSRRTAATGSGTRYREGVWPRRPHGCGAVPQPHPDARARPASTISSRPMMICGGWSRIPSPTDIEHTDGLKCTMLLMSGLLRDFNFAAEVRGPARAVLHPDVPAHARRPHHARQLSSARS